jgi:hypothetical protein
MDPWLSDDEDRRKGVFAFAVTFVSLEKLDVRVSIETLTCEVSVFACGVSTSWDASA